MLDQLGLHFFSVCDGHGVHGELVSGYVRDNLPSKFTMFFALIQLFSNFREAQDPPK